MAAVRALSALLTLPALASCSFLLDFDALQKGAGGMAGGGHAGSSAAGSSSGGVSAEGGAPEGATSGVGPAGAAGAGECPSECFHNDPCVRDGCDASGRCLTGRVTGLAPDGIDTTVLADTHYRVTMIGGDSAFYLSSFATTAGKPEVTFYELDATKKELTTLGTIGGLAITGTGDPVSAAGLAFEPVVGKVHAFVALSDRVGTHSRVWHVVLGPQDSVPKPVALGSLTAGYYADSPYNYPSALYAGSHTYTAWINADRTISLSDGSDAAPAVLSAATQASTLSLLTAQDDTPGVLYGVSGGGVLVERPGVMPVSISECQPAPGDYLSSSTTFTNLPGVWLGAWTKLAGDPNPFLTTNGRFIVCSGDTCGGDTSTCPDNSANNLVRNPASVIVHRPGDPTSLMETVGATPFLTSQGSQVIASLVLTQQSADLNPKQASAKATDLGPPITLATAPTSADESYRGPDWPAVAFVPPDRFAVAWTAPTGNGDELRIQRYRMCLAQ
jgi:hypothetical protein